MAKVTSTDIIDLGFTKEMFRKATDDDFEEFIDDIIAEQAAVLEGLVGTSAYASATSPTKDYIKRAERCLVAAELVQRRINIILANVTGAGQEIDVTSEGSQKKQYADEADRWINRISNGDYSGSVLETDHFNSEGETWLAII